MPTNQTILAELLANLPSVGGIDLSGSAKIDCREGYGNDWHVWITQEGETHKFYRAGGGAWKRVEKFNCKKEKTND